MNWIMTCLRKYVDFSGRARRKEFWMFYLFYFVVLIVATLIDNLLGITFDLGYGQKGFYGPLYTLTTLGLFLPMLAAAVRRLHDVGKSGWWYFIALVPLVGGIWLLVLFFTDSQPGENKYGPNPKEVPAQVT